ncbi:MAG: hypothetical protein ACT4QF_03305 [Sporichthyaceae bacterium]
MAAPSQTRPSPPKAGVRPRRARRRYLIVAGVAVVVLAAGGAGAALLMGGDDAPPEAGPQIVKPSKDDAQNVAEALAKLPSRPQDLVATDSRSAVATKARQAVPKNATVTADPATWHADGLGGGTITVLVRIPGQPVAIYTAIMIKESTGWKVVMTIPMAAPAKGTQPALPNTAPVPNVPKPPPAKNPPPAAPPLQGDAPPLESPAPTKAAR